MKPAKVGERVTRQLYPMARFAIRNTLPWRDGRLKNFIVPRAWSTRKVGFNNVERQARQLVYTSGLVHTAFGRLQYLSSSGTALSRATTRPRSLCLIIASSDDDDEHYATDNGSIGCYTHLKKARFAGNSVRFLVRLEHTKIHFCFMTCFSSIIYLKNSQNKFLNISL